MNFWRSALEPSNDNIHQSGASVSVSGASVQRGRVVALRDVTFELPAGSLTAVIGPNGAGKSSLFGLLSGRIAPTAGSVHLRGSVAEVLQATNVDEQLALTVNDVVRLGRYPSLGLVRRFSNKDRAVINDSLNTVDLAELGGRPFTELSGGQQQRALLAQGLAQEAPILLLDEPTTGLDVTSQLLVRDVMRAQAKAGTTVLFATHDLTEAAQADFVVVLACECICCAPPIDALADASVTALFGPGPGRIAQADSTGADNAEQPQSRTAEQSLLPR